MRLMVCSDLHGVSAFYDRALTQAVNENVDYLLLGGDLFPESSELHTSLEVQEEFLELAFTPFLEALQARRVHVILILGNHDWAYLVPRIMQLEERGLCIYAHQRVVMLGKSGYAVVGLNCVPPSQYYKKDWERLTQRQIEVEDTVDYFSRPGVPEIYERKARSWFKSMPTLAEEVDALPAPPGGWSKGILFSHCPPYDTPLDRHYSGKPLGSSAIKSFILSRQPYMSLHGHIHESPRVTGQWLVPIRKTLAMNPGQSLHKEQFHAVTLELENPQQTARHTVFGLYQPVAGGVLSSTGRMKVGPKPVLPPSQVFTLGDENPPTAVHFPSQGEAIPEPLGDLGFAPLPEPKASWTNTPAQGIPGVTRVPTVTSGEVPVPAGQFGAAQWPPAPPAMGGFPPEQPLSPQGGAHSPFPPANANAPMGTPQTPFPPQPPSAPQTPQRPPSGGFPVTPPNRQTGHAPPMSPLPPAPPNPYQAPRQQPAGDQADNPFAQGQPPSLGTDRPVSGQMPNFFEDPPET